MKSAEVLELLLRGKRTMKLPKQVMVIWAGTDDEPYLSASEDSESIEDGTEVGIYTLMEKNTKRVEHTLIPKSKTPKRRNERAPQKTN